MGSEAVRSLAGQGDNVIMACRNLSKAESVRRDILKDIPGAEIDVVELDLSSMASVKTFADSVAGMKIDALFNNAGIINRDYRRTEDGYESTLATNYIGPFYLTRLLLPQMPAGSNIVNMVSLTCRFGDVDRTLFERGEKEFHQLRTYSNTKLALLLSSVALSRRYEGIHVNVADPGIVNSNMISMGRWFDPLADILFRPFCRSPRKGVAPALRALRTDYDLHCFIGRRDEALDKTVLDHPMIDWLWDETEKLLPLRPQ